MYSYVFVYFASHLVISSELLEVHLRVSTPVEDSLVVDQVCRSCVVTIQGLDTRIDLVALDLMILILYWHGLAFSSSCGFGLLCKDVTLAVPRISPSSVVGRL